MAVTASRAPAPWRALVALTSRRETGESLALFRIAIGAVMTGSLLAAIGPGIVDVVWIDAADGGMRHLGRGGWLVDALGGPTPAVVWGLVWTSLAAAICLTLGLAGRLSALVALQSYAALRELNAAASGGYDTLLVNAAWLLVLSASTATLSLDAWLRDGRVATRRLVHAWPRHLVILQLVVMYTATGWQKASALWTPAGGYSALYWVLVEPTWRRATDPTFAAWIDPLLRLGTAVTWHWETLAPLLLVLLAWRRRPHGPGRLRVLANRLDLRSWWVAVGVALHVGILILLDVGPFSFASLAYYVAIYPPGDWRALGRRLTRALRRPIDARRTARRSAPGSDPARHGA